MKAPAFTGLYDAALYLDGSPWVPPSCLCFAGFNEIFISMQSKS